MFEVLLPAIEELWIGKVEETDPRSVDYSLTPLHGLPYGLHCGLPYRLPPRTNLNKHQMYICGGKRHKKPTCSTYTIMTV